MSTYVLESALAPEEKARVLSRIRQIIWLGSEGGVQMFRAPSLKMAREVARTCGRADAAMWKATGDAELPETD
jgi:hypothetical protein